MRGGVAPSFFAIVEANMLSGIPTFSTSGFVHEPKQMLDKILAYYEALNFSGTLLYQNNVQSLARAIFDTTGDINLLIDRVKSDLTGILKKNFPEAASVEVTAELLDETETYNLIVSASVSRDGKQYDLAGSINSVPSTWAKFTNARKVYLTKL